MVDCILLGLPRSGTTLIGRLLAHSGHFNYEEEPNPVWRYRNFSRYRHDEYASSDATPEVRAFVEAYFRDRTRRANKRAFLEKTPANCLRGAFVQEIFPQARYVVITRQADRVAKSIERKVLGTDPNARLLGDERLARDFRTRLRKCTQIPLRDYPAYLHEVSGRIAHLRHGPKDRFWGPRPKDWERLEAMPFEARIVEHVARMQAGLDDFCRTCTAPLFVFDYDDLARSPDHILGGLEDFLGLRQGTLQRSLIQPQGAP